MNLKLQTKTKKIIINDTEIIIPTLGLRHYLMTKNIENPVECMEIILKSIHPNLSVAEYDYLIMFLLEFNGKLNSSIEHNNETLYLKDIYISQLTEFQFQGNTFKFNSPPRGVTGLPDEVLGKYYTGNQGEIDFLEMPAFVLNWMNQLVDTISIRTKSGKITGSGAIMELFSNGEI